jgi:hypothetical protein
MTLPLPSFSQVCSRQCAELILYPFISHVNEDDITRGYFQQDGAAAHTAVSMAFLPGMFGERLISRDI